MLKLIKSDLPPNEQQRLIRIQLDAYMLQRLTDAQARCVYSELECVRDALSRILDRLDGKHV
jgi:hypothetical protein